MALYNFILCSCQHFNKSFLRDKLFWDQKIRLYLLHLNFCSNSLYRCIYVLLLDIFCIWIYWIWLFCKFSCCDLWLYQCLSLYRDFCIVARDLLFPNKLVRLFIGVVMISFLESKLFFKLAIFCCNVFVFWFWQQPIIATVLLIFSKYDSNFSCIAVGLSFRWRVSRVWNCSKVGVFCYIEGLRIYLTFCNKGASVWIANWGISFEVLGVNVSTESSSALSDLVSGVGCISLWSTLLRYKES